MLLLAMLPACSAPEQADFRQESFVFGTRVEIIIHGADEARAARAASEVLRRFDALHRKLHAWEPSALDALNTAFAAGPERQILDPELARLLEDAKRFSLASGELFNPAIGNLIRLWGFHGNAAAGHVPARADIDRLLQARPSMRNIHLSGNGAASDNPAVRLDLGGYAKGYALDAAAALLREHGIRHALVNIGGNVIALGRHGQRPWRVGIQHPRKAGVIATLDLRDGEAMGTSGDYQRYFEAGGRRYCHLLDPRSGEPASGMQSITLLLSGERAGVRSDVLSKPFFVGGAAELETWLFRLNIAAILAIEADGTVRLTDTMRQRLRWQAPDQAFELIGGSKEDFVTRK
jgi:thiamine biosynthesis lipoprotein